MLFTVRYTMKSLLVSSESLTTIYHHSSLIFILIRATHAYIRQTNYPFSLRSSNKNLVCTGLLAQAKYKPLLPNPLDQLF